MTKRAVLIPLLIVAFALAVPDGATRAFAQKAPSKDVVETAFPSKVGDRAQYAVTLVKRGAAGNSDLTTDVTVEISRADEAGFLVTWTYGKFQMYPPGQEGNAEVLKLLDLTRSVSLVLQVDPRRTGVKLENWEEIHERLGQALEGLQEQTKAGGAIEQKTGTFMTLIRTFYQNQDFMTSYYTKEPTLFFSYMGKRIPASQPVVNNFTLPNPLGGDPFPARGQISVKEYDPDHHRAVILSTTTLDPLQMPGIMEKVTRDLVAKLAPGLEGQIPKDMIKALSIDSKTEVAIDLVSGWPESLAYETSTRIEMAMPQGGPEMKFRNEETIAMKRIPGKED
jgi:hypothetical protein